MKKGISFFLFLLILSCSEEDPPVILNDPISSKITGFSNGSFVDEDGNSFFPWGFNYTNTDETGLIEDNWNSSEVMTIIRKDFHDMKTLSANVIRIHLQYHRFMLDPTTPNQKNLSKLTELVRMAEEIGLYLDITGLAAYRKTDSPVWYDELTDDKRWETHKIFWKSIAREVGQNKAVLSYNLMNEPVVSVGCEVGTPCSWLPGDGFGGYHFVQNITREPGKLNAPTKKEWIAELSNAIRAEDQETMITVGFLPLGDVKQYESDLDFVSIHIYPKSGEIQKSLDFINSNLTTPLVIEEISNLNCTIEELEKFLDDIDGNYHGFYGHFHGKTLNELSSFSITDALNKQFFELFVRRNPN